ncbi:VPS5 [Candida theae]|uniref:VPS5 n=1 Tax=Candida theae TaxID=1198502 RepID=A0AAD5BF07_9ASCO|nr:VPS5 [Candida theae]KAI5958636.1 VPS5 [Candida theae]
MDEDLTKSVWDDEFDSNKPSNDHTASGFSEGLSNSSSFGQSITPLANNFQSYSIDDPFANPFEDKKPESDEDNDQDEEEAQNFSNLNLEQEQIHELKSEERKELKSQLLSELTNGSEESDILSQKAHERTPKHVSKSDELFHDKESPVKLVPSGEETTLSPSKTLNVKKFKAGRPRKFNSKTNVHHLNPSQSGPTSGESPLGPLGGATKVVKDVASEPQQHNQQPEKSGEKVIDDSKGLHEPKKQSRFRKDENELDITVADPTKVGDITSAHIVYTIRTRNKNPESSNFPNLSTAEVTRRYRDFRWIYHQLQANHPGRVIPPPPSKQSIIGRFNEKLIEHRRFALEKMLRNISNKPGLANDPDFISFLTNDGDGRFNEGGDLESSAYNEGGHNNSTTSSAASVATNAAIASTGFMSSLFSSSSKFVDPDQYFVEKKNYLDDLEYNLKQFAKTIDLIGTQRQDMINILEELAITVEELSALEISKATADILNAFSEVEFKIKDNLDRLNISDQLTIGFTIDEYLRIIESINYVFQTRTKIHQSYSSLTSQIDKLTKKQPLSPERSFEVEKLKERQSDLKKQFDDISATIKTELEEFELNRIDDFRNNVEIYVESSIESQKEAIEFTYDSTMSIQVHFNDVKLSVISIPRSKLWIFANSIVQLLYDAIGDEKNHRDSSDSSENGTDYDDADDDYDSNAEGNDMEGKHGKPSADFEGSTRKSVDNSSKPQLNPTSATTFADDENAESNCFFHIAMTPSECTIICSASLSTRFFAQPLKLCKELGYSDVEVLPEEYLSLVVDSDGSFAKSHRILELTKPLSENDVSLFYISSHFNDVVLIPSHLKKRVEKILVSENFIFSESSGSYISTYDVDDKEEEPVLSDSHQRTFGLLANHDIHPQIHEKHKVLLTGARPGEIKYCILKTIKLISLATSLQPSYFAITRTFSNELSLILPQSNKMRSKYGYKSTSIIGSSQDVLVPIAMDLSKLPINCTGIVAGLANKLIIRGGNMLEIGYLSMAKSGVILIPEEDLGLARSSLSEF